MDIKYILKISGTPQVIEYPVLVNICVFIALICPE